MFLRTFFNLHIDLISKFNLEFLAFMVFENFRLDMTDLQRRELVKINFSRGADQ